MSIPETRDVPRDETVLHFGPSENLTRKSIKLQGTHIEFVVAPARDSIQYIVKKEVAMLLDNVLTGPPTPEADKAWEEFEKREAAFKYSQHIFGLTNGCTAFMLRLSEDEMNKMGKTSLALKDGSGYIGYLESFHMLHCVVCLISWTSSSHLVPHTTSDTGD